MFCSTKKRWLLNYKTSVSIIVRFYSHPVLFIFLVCKVPLHYSYYTQTSATILTCITTYYVINQHYVMSLNKSSLRCRDPKVPIDYLNT